VSRGAVDQGIAPTSAAQRIDIDIDIDKDD